MISVSSNGFIVATGLSTILDGEVSHDSVMIRIYTSKDVQKEVKSTVCKIQGGSVCLIFDETIQEKNWTDESEIMYWHF